MHPRAGAGAPHVAALVRLPLDYRVTREGMVYLGGIFVVALAALNTGNNLLFMMLACLLAGILISGVLSQMVLSGVEVAAGVARAHLRRPTGVWRWPNWSTTKQIVAFVFAAAGEADQRQSEGNANPASAREILDHADLFPLSCRSSKPYSSAWI